MTTTTRPPAPAKRAELPAEVPSEVPAGRPGERPTWRHQVRTRARRIADAALTPLDLDDVLDVFVPLRSGADLRARVVEIRPETATSATLVLEPGRDWAGHLPGQFLRVGVDVDGVRRWRTYSLTHGPRADRHISITVKEVPDGIVSGHLVRRARVGDMIHLGQAEGDFVLPADSGSAGSDSGLKLLLVTAGSGITPVIGMLRNLFSRSTPAPVDIVLLHSALSHAEVIFGEELRAYAARGLLQLIELHTAASGRLETGDLARLVPDLAERTTYACGPVGLLDALEAHHAEHGLPLTVERFRLPTVVAGAGGTLTFADGATVEAAGDRPILDVAEDAGVLMPSGCRMGVCFGCVLPLRSGAVRDLRNGEVTFAADGDGVAIQTCISAAAGPCVLDH